MDATRRQIALGAAGFAVGAATSASADTGAPRYGLITQLIAVQGKRQDLIQILTRASGGMPGCLAYLVAADAARDDAVWVTEAWTSKAAHAASLDLPQVRAAIDQGRPFIAGVGTRAETIPASVVLGAG
jgi:quinol monooxygenase YgiN